MLKQPLPKAVQANRALAARALDLVLRAHRALDVALEQVIAEQDLHARDRGHVAALCFAALRYARSYEVVLATLMQKPADPLMHALLLIGCADLHALRSPAHAGVGEAVNAARELAHPHAAGMVNAVLRKFAGGFEAMIATAQARSNQARFGLPSWLSHALQKHYPQHFAAICAAHQAAGPLWLRVNQQKSDCHSYAAQLQVPHTLHAHLPNAICLAESVPVSSLPGFDIGSCSVQDGAAQWAAYLLAPVAGERILDACAAPGGKTAHLLELAPGAQIIAVERDPARARLIAQNLQRIGLQAEIQVADVAELGLAQTGFDAILLDAPCSATGVIRRHPDISYLRRESDIPTLVATQRRLLDALWPRLKPGGRLLYATCSLLPEENTQQIQAFLQRTPDAQLQSLPTWFGIEQDCGRQNLPGQNDMDGFYYALLQRARA
jgi:16S rRNA (cytosine967-C5)-methyltransferase